MRLLRCQDLVAPPAAVKEGRFELTGLEAGAYAILANAKGRPVTRELELAPGETRAVALK